MSWVLVIAILHSGHVALTNVPGFSSEAACKAEAEKHDGLAVGPFSHYRFACVRVG